MAQTKGIKLSLQGWEGLQAQDVLRLWESAEVGQNDNGSKYLYFFFAPAKQVLSKKCTTELHQ